MSKSFAYVRIIESKLQYFNISGEIPSGLAAFPSIKLFFTATYSSVVKFSVDICRSASLLICVGSKLSFA